MDLFWVYFLIGMILLVQLIISFVLIQIVKLVRIGNITGIETAKQVSIIDRNTYPKSNSKKYQ